MYEVSILKALRSKVVLEYRQQYLCFVLIARPLPCLPGAKLDAYLHKSETRHKNAHNLSRKVSTTPKSPPARQPARGNQTADCVPLLPDLLPPQISFSRLIFPIQSPLVSHPHTHSLSPSLSLQHAPESLPTAQHAVRTPKPPSGRITDHRLRLDPLYSIHDVERAVCDRRLAIPYRRRSLRFYGACVPARRFTVSME